MELGFTQVLGNIEKEVNGAIQKKCSEFTNDFQKTVTDAKEELRKYVKERPTVVIRGDAKHEVAGLRHKKLNTLITLVGADQNVLLVGSAGTGKTKSASQVAEALGIDFYCQSVGSQTSKSDLLGYMDANGKYVETAFRRAYEKGGVFCMDEIDAGNSNVLIVLNSALANGVCSFPDKMVERNKDFRFIGTANTYGNGADRTYVGRNQLDGATLDRFVVIDWDVDDELEKSLVEPYGEAGIAWLETIWDLRKEVERSGIRAIISPRMTVKCAVTTELGNSVDDVIDMCILPQIPSDKKETIKTRVKDQFNTRFERIKKENAKKKKPEAKKEYEMELPF